jgi:DMSO reductase family type II enzyme heme b subunit
MRLAFLAALLVFAACVQPAPLEVERGPAAAEGEAVALAADGAGLFTLHCATCHGAEGRADGEASAFLFPPARDFSRGNFRLVSTDGGPTEADLVSVIRRGMPGSSMPAWGHLPDHQLSALVGHVLSLARSGLTDRLLSEARREGEPMTREGAGRLARERLEPGEPLPVPPDDLEVTDALIVRGAEVYAQSCSSCHGADGTGEGAPLWTEEGEVTWARDLTAGYVKGGVSREALAHRIGAGLPGSAMPPTRLSPEDLGALVAFVQSLVPDGTETRFVHRRVRLRAERIPRPLPLSPDDPAWSWAEEQEIVLAPLAWRDESVVYAVVGAVHDGETVAIRVRWPDASGEVALFSDTYETDAVAVQFSSAQAPPLFGMGAPGRPTNVWHWRSLRLSDIAGALDLVDVSPHVYEPSRLEEVRLDVPVYRRLEGVPELARHGDTLTTSGVASVAEAQSSPGEVDAVPRWSEGEWAVVFSRTLDPAGQADVRLNAGTSVRFACAIWNGSAGDQGPQKSISIWHELAIDP